MLARSDHQTRDQWEAAYESQPSAFGASVTKLAEISRWRKLASGRGLTGGLDASEPEGTSEKPTSL